MWFVLPLSVLRETSIDRKNMYTHTGGTRTNFFLQLIPVFLFFCFWLGSHFLQVTLSEYFFLSRSNKKQVGLTLSVVGSDVTRNEEERRRRSDLERTSNWTERQAIITKVDSRSLFFSRRRGTPSLIHHLLILIFD